MFPLCSSGRQSIFKGCSLYKQPWKDIQNKMAANAYRKVYGIVRELRKHVFQQNKHHSFIQKYYGGSQVVQW